MHKLEFTLQSIQKHVVWPLLREINHSQVTTLTWPNMSYVSKIIPFNKVCSYTIKLSNAHWIGRYNGDFYDTRFWIGHTKGWCDPPICLVDSTHLIKAIQQPSSTLESTHGSSKTSELNFLLHWNKRKYYSDLIFKQKKKKIHIY